MKETALIRSTYLQLALALVIVAPKALTAATPEVSWTSAPSRLVLLPGTEYGPKAKGTDTDGNLSTVSIDVSANGGQSWSPLAYAGGGDGYSSQNNGNPFSVTAGNTYVFRAWATDSSGGNSGYIYTHKYSTSQFKIIIDINQIGGPIPNTPIVDEQLYNAVLASDGVWSVINSANSPNMASYWTTTLSALRTSRHTAVEQVFHEYPGVDNAALTTLYGGSVHKVMVYDEAKFRSGNYAFLDSVLSASQVGTVNGWFGNNNNVIVHSRSYGGGGIYPSFPGGYTGTWSDGVTNYPLPPTNGQGVPTAEYRGWYVDAAYARPACAGLSFEIGPGDSSSAMWYQNFNAGIAKCINDGKSCYLLLAAKGGSTDYLGDVMAALPYFTSSLFSSPNLYIVPAAYVRQDYVDNGQTVPGTHIGFLYPDSGTPARNSVFAVVNWLKAFRESGNSTSLVYPLVSGNRYRIISMNSAKPIEVSGGSASDGASVLQSGIVSDPRQVWTAVQVNSSYWKFVNVNSGKVLEVPGASNTEGTNMDQSTWTNSNWQQWTVESVGGGAYKIVNRGSGKCLDVEGYSLNNAANIHQWTYLSGPNQKWTFELAY